MADLEDAITAAKDKLPDVTPTPPGFSNHATVHQLKSRLNWGEPGLTIVDVRDRSMFNECHIMGALNMPMDELVGSAQHSLSPKRDIYVYGVSDQETASAAQLLRTAGFQRVAELAGGLNAWREIGGPMDGPATTEPPSAGAYNLGDRLREFAEIKAKEGNLK